MLELLEPHRLDWFCAFFDLLTYTGDINYFSGGWSALGFPALGQLLRWTHQERKEEQRSAHSGPLSYRASDFMALLYFQNNAKGRETNE